MSKQYILMEVNEDREFDIDEELDTLEGVEMHSITKEQIDWLYYKLAGRCTLPKIGEEILTILTPIMNDTTEDDARDLAQEFFNHILATNDMWLRDGETLDGALQNEISGYQGSGFIENWYYPFDEENDSMGFYEKFNERIDLMNEIYPLNDMIGDCSKQYIIDKAMECLTNALANKEGK